MKKLKIDIVSDVMCPWCIIGYKNLNTALEQLRDEFSAQINWKPFELNPDMPPEGQDLDEHLQQKYGLNDEQAEKNRQHLAQMGEQAGFTFNFERKRKMINSFDLHRLLTWAETQSKQTELKLALFKANFTDLVSLNDQPSLLNVVQSVGLDRERAKEILESGEYFQTVRSEQNTLQQMGITSVPTFIINDEYALTGAQTSEAFVQALEQIATQQANQQQ